MFELTVEELDRLIRDDPKLYYRTKELNEKLYLNNKGYNRLQNLHHFPSLKVLYANNNGFSRIEGLSSLKKLRSLYLDYNNISSIEGLDSLDSLSCLSLSGNCLKRIEGISLLPITTLNLSDNLIGLDGIQDLYGLFVEEKRSLSIDYKNNIVIGEEGGIKVVSDSVIESGNVLGNILSETLRCLDLKNNKISISVAEIALLMSGLQNINVLYLQGNSVRSSIKEKIVEVEEGVRDIGYRRTLIYYLQHLRYLDDYPVFPQERRSTEAYKSRGIDGETDMRDIILKEKKLEREKQFNDFDKMIECAKNRGG